MTETPCPLNAQVTGSGRPMVVLHGLFGAARNWSGVARRLGEQWQVHALDLRNHGESPWRDSMDYRAMAADVVAYMDAQGLGTPVLIGHSMGGKVAMTAALEHGNRFSALVVADIAPVAYRSTLSSFVEAMLAVPLDQLDRRSQAEPHLREVVKDPGVRQFLLQNLTQDAGGPLRWRINLEVLKAEMGSVIGFPALPDGTRFEGPTLFVRGELSDYVRDSHRPTIDRLFPNAVMAAIKGSGHWVHAEKPDAFIETVQGFLARVEG